MKPSMFIDFLKILPVHDGITDTEIAVEPTPVNGIISYPKHNIYVCEYSNHNALLRNLPELINDPRYSNANYPSPYKKALALGWIRFGINEKYGEYSFLISPNGDTLNLLRRISSSTGIKMSYHKEHVNQW